MFEFPLLFALGFSQLLMLGWLAAAAAPLLIHLWNKRKYREVQWAAMQYLLAAIQKNSRRLQIEHWLLLAIRTAIIVLAVLAVAGPSLDQTAGSFGSDAPTHKLIVIDGSFSMGYRPTDKTLFDRAKELATEIVEQSRQGDGFTLLLMSSPPRVIVGTPAFSPRDFLAEIQNLRMPHGGADLAGTLAKVDEIVKNVNASQQRLTQHQVYFLTDLGRTSWDPNGAAGASATRSTIDRLAQEAGLYVVDLGQPQTQNLALTELRSSRPFATTGSNITFEAVLRNFSSQARSDPVEFVVDGQRIKDGVVDAPANGDGTINFSHRFETAGDHIVEVRVLGDALSIDNHRWLALPVKAQLEALIVNGESNRRAADYLRFALDPDSGKHGAQLNATKAAGAGSVHTTVVSESGLQELDLSKFDCVFLSNVAQFTAGEAHQLSNYLRSGGSLVFFLGDRVLADRYNDELGGKRPGSLRVLPLLLDKPTNTSRYSFDPLDYRHPIVAEYRGNVRAGLLQTPVSKYFRMLAITGDASQAEAVKFQTALAFAETGDPAIVTEQIDRGWVTFVALPASLESVDPVTKTPWTLMTATQSFQPIVQEILAWSLRGKNRDRNSIVGESIGATPMQARTETSLLMRTPDGRSEQVLLSHENAESRWSFADTWFSGVYEAKPVGADAINQSFAVNVDTTESDLTKISLEELPRGMTSLVSWNDSEERSDQKFTMRGGLHRPLLYAVLMLLFVETLLAWWLGYRAG